jgi:hypothetical protein
MSLIAVGSGIFAGLLMVFIVDQFAGTVSDRSQLERLAEIKVLGSILICPRRKLRALRRYERGWRGTETSSIDDLMKETVWTGVRRASTRLPFFTMR